MIMYKAFQQHLQNQLDAISSDGLMKTERIITSPQSAAITLSNGSTVLNFCANNYLGLSDNPQIKAAAVQAIERYGYGMSSVRFICGTTDLHKALEATIAGYFGTEDTILYAACFDANGGVFEPLLTEEDAIISDTLNHASIIDGVRLCKAQRYKYNNADMVDLETQLTAASKARFRLIVTDGVFSMDGNTCPLDKILSLSEKYNAMIMVDESHSAGVVGRTGGGVTEHYNAKGQVEIITGTLGKAFGGAIGGFTTGKKEIIEVLRQKSRPYLFSNSIPPMVAAAGIEAFNLLSHSNELQEKLHHNTERFVSAMLTAGFNIKPTTSAICAVMLFDAKLSAKFAELLLSRGIYVRSFSFPVVPRDQARIRVQLSAAHSTEHILHAISAFIEVGKFLKVI